MDAFTTLLTPLSATLFKPMHALTSFVQHSGPATLVYQHVPGFPQLVGYADAVNEGVQLGDVKVARMLLCLLLAYIPGMLTPTLPHALLRHAWCLVIGVLSVQFVFGAGWLHLAIPATAVYAVTAFFRATGLLPGLGHWVAALISFSYLIYRHLSRDAAFANGIDDSTLTMVLVVKLYTLCYNLYDADHPEASKGMPARIQEQRARRAIKALPNPLAYYAYVFNFSTVFTGPAFEFGEYATAQGTPSDAGHLTSRWLPGGWKFVQGLVWFGLTAVLQAIFKTDDLFALSHTEPSTPRYALAIMLALIFSRFKYYAIWKLSEGAAVLAGFGYRAALPEGRKANPAVEDFEAFTGVPLRAYFKSKSGVDAFGLGIKDAADWEGASNCNPLTVETRVSIQDTIANWNTHVQSWLANYFALRLPKSVSRPLTFLASAFWHGFYPGYYVTFVSAWLFQDSARGVLEVLKQVLPAGTFNAGGILVGPVAPAAAGSDSITYTWSRPLRLLVWLLQWLTHAVFLVYAGTAFVIIGRDPHCQKEHGAWEDFCGAEEPSVFARIIAIYTRLGWACHLVALTLYVLTAVIGAVSGGKKEGGKEGSKPVGTADKPKRG